MQIAQCSARYWCCTVPVLGESPVARWSLKVGALDGGLPVGFVDPMGLAAHLAADLAARWPYHLFLLGTWMRSGARHN